MQAMKYWQQKLALMEEAALRCEAREIAAERTFDEVRARIEAAGATVGVTTTPELGSWLRAHAETDSAWGLWAVVMEQRPAANADEAAVSESR
jgi:hypothetical protein